MSFVLGVLQSIIASFIFAVYGAEKKTASKNAFTERAKNFHSEISPNLLENIIPLRLPNVAKKLHEEIIHNDPITFAYIDLYRGKDITISRSLQTNISNFSVNEKFITWLKDELGKRLTNDPTFSLNSVSTENKLSLSVGSYFETLSTSDIHYFNLIRYFPLKSGVGCYFAYKHSKYVTNWLNALERVSEANMFSHYCASVGCSVLTVLKSSDEQYKYLLKTNSEEKNSAGDRHVVPSFMFQPISKRITEQERELSLELNVIKEYGEELLGMDELEEADTFDALMQNMLENKQLKKLYSLIKNKKAHLEITGFIIDIYRLRPEITFLLIIHDDKFSKNIKTNWETERRSLDMVKLNDDNAYYEILKSTDTPLCSPGVAALINGRSRALSLLGK